MVAAATAAKASFLMAFLRTVALDGRIQQSTDFVALNLSNATDELRRSHEYYMNEQILYLMNGH
jgi:hypothetical protein